ncbi:MAG: interleukin-like EMT inducer domain-containing protein, partial [Eubacteriales bacterium]|nr:interleukin-like EMT inducer domain-containing protein [Eubacteriales bacterium]
QETYRLHSTTLKNVIFDTSMLRWVPEDSRYRKALDGMRFSKIKYDAINDKSSDFVKSFLKLFSIFYYHDRWSMNGEKLFERRMNPAKYTRGYHFETKKYIDHEVYSNITVPSFIEKNVDDYAEFNEESICYLEKMIEFCKKNNIKLTFTKTPVSTWGDSEHNSVQKIADEYGIKFIDFNYLPYIDEIDYNDATNGADGLHMNYYGATKLTDWFGKYLTEECAATDIRGQEKYAFMEEELEKYKRSIIKISLDEIIDPAEYLKKLVGNDYIIFVFARNNAASALTQEQRQYFDSIGLEQLADLITGDSYLAVINNTDIEIEKRELVGEDEHAGAYSCFNKMVKSYTIESGGSLLGDTAFCEINGVRYDAQGNGLNFVVYDKETKTVVDQTYFDTGDSATRELLDLGNGFKAFVNRKSEIEKGLKIYNAKCDTVKRNLTKDSDDLLRYLQDNWEDSNTLVLLTVKGDASKALTPEIRKVFQNMGLTELSKIEKRDSYIAVASGGNILFEKRDHGKQPLEHVGAGYQLISGGRDSGNMCEINIGNVPYAQGKRGINMVLYNTELQEVMFSYSLDTHKVTPTIPED